VSERVLLLLLPPLPLLPPLLLLLHGCSRSAAENRAMDVTGQMHMRLKSLGWVVS
jgi:hypothetical protein